jgi:hypothetical protein
MSNIEIIPCGTKATTAIGSIKGIITGITIRYNAIAYELTHLDINSHLVTTWMNEAEFTTECTEKNQIGFRNNDIKSQSTHEQIISMMKSDADLIPVVEALTTYIKYKRK